MNLLQLFFTAFLGVFGQSVLYGFLQGVDGITACITYTYLGSFSFSLTLFGKLFTAFFRQWRDADTDNLTIVSGMMPRLESMMAFSMTRNMLLSHGLMAMLRASGVVTAATLLIGTILP